MVKLNILLYFSEMVGILDVLISKVRYVCGVAFVSMVGTNFHDSKVIKGASAPGPNVIRPPGPNEICIYRL